MNVNGLIGKIESNADKLGWAYGLLADPIASGRGISGAPAFIIDRLTHWKIPNPQSLIEALMWKDGPYYKALETGAIVYIAGEFLNKSALKKFGETAFKATLLSSVLYIPAINPSLAALKNPGAGAAGSDYWRGSSE